MAEAIASLATPCYDGGMVIDLPDEGDPVDPVDRTVRAQAGVLLGELDHETQAFGLIVPAGFVSHTGLAGLTLGGIGFTMRRFGLTIDNLLSVDLITAEGSLSGQTGGRMLTCSGGAGRWGELRDRHGVRVPAPSARAPGRGGPRVLADRRRTERLALLPTGSLTTRRSDDAGSPNEERLRSKACLPISSGSGCSPSCCYAGSVEEGGEGGAAALGFSSPVLDLCEPRPFVEHQQMYDASFESGWHYYLFCDVAELNDDVIDIMVEHGRRIESPISSVGLWQLGGAVARVGEDGTAFNGRAAGHTFNINGNSQRAEGFDEEREWARGLWTALEPYHTSVYVNFMMDEVRTVRQAYGPAKYQRLTALKRQYDPDNFFRLNQNIPPG